MSNRPLIVYFGPFLLPNRNAACVRVISNAKIFRDLGYDVDIVGFESKPSSEGKLSSSDPSINLYSYPASPAGYLSSFRINPMSAITHLRQRGADRQITHVICYNYPSFAQAGLQFWCKANQSNFLPDITEWNTEISSANPVSLIRGLDTSVRIRLLAKFADALIVTSSMVADYFGTKKSRPIANLPTLFDKSQIETHIKQPRSQEAPLRLMFVGPGFDTSLTSVPPASMKERVDLIVDVALAVSKMGKETTLEFFGLTADQYFHAIEGNDKRRNEIEAVVNFRGRVPNEEIIDALASSEFSMIFRDNKPANNAGFPTKFAESLMSGTPVIIDEIEAVKTYFDNEHVLQLERADPETMARQLLTSVGDYRKMRLSQSVKEADFQLFHFARFTAEAKRVISDRSSG